jgi:hypothetical protein
MRARLLNRRAVLGGCTAALAVAAPGLTWGKATFWLLPRRQRLDSAPVLSGRALTLSDPAAPQIVIDSPHPDAGPLKAPLDIIVRFVSPSGAVIDPTSFKVEARVFGGWFDVTREIRKHARVKPDGVAATGAMLPAGDHRIRLQIKDGQNRLGQAEIAFKVV